MKLLDTIKEKTKKASLLFGDRSFSITVHSPHTFSKTTKKVSWTLVIDAHKKLTIQQIDYHIHELIDPIIGKNKAEAEELWTRTSKKKLTLDSDSQKEIAFSIPILFSNEHGRKKTWWDMALLNAMSERSKKTAVNYDLTVTIKYTLNWESKTKQVNHSIWFE